VSLSEGAIGGGREKENVVSIFIEILNILNYIEYNIMHCTVSC
jgi:hypothetical protein